MPFTYVVGCGINRISSACTCSSNNKYNGRRTAQNTFCVSSEKNIGFTRNVNMTPPALTHHLKQPFALPLQSIPPTCIGSHAVTHNALRYTMRWFINFENLYT